MNEPPSIIMDTVREWRGGDCVELATIHYEGQNRLVIRAYNEGGHNCTHVDLLDLIYWVEKNKPQLLMREEQNELHQM